MNKQRKLTHLRKINGKTQKIVVLMSLRHTCVNCRSIIMLFDFSYHLQIHDWGLIYFHLKEENAWDIIFEVTNFRLFLSARTSIIGFHKTEDNKY